MLKRILLTLFFPIVLINNILAGTDSLQNNTNWRAISLPYNRTIAHAVIVDSANGWFYSEHNYSLFQLKDNIWQRIELPKNYQCYSLFGFDHNNIWVACYDKLTYRYFLRRFDGKFWSNIYPPNTDRIKDLHYQSENNIWGVCEWGEIIHFDGEKWELIPASTYFHLNKIIMINDSSGWFWSEYRDGKSYLFEKKPNNWDRIEIKHYFPVESIKFLYPLLDIDDLKNDSLFVFRDNTWFSPYLSSLTRDTIYINCEGFGNFLYFNKNGTVVKKGDASIFNNFDNGSIEIIYNVQNHDNFIFHINNFGHINAVKLVNREQKFKSFSVYLGMSYFNEYGAVFVDVNNDGLEDILSIDTNRENRLHLANIDKKDQIDLNLDFLDAAEKFNLIGLNRGEEGEMIYDMGATAADIDNDGDCDIYVTSLYDKNMLFKNVKGRRFQEIGTKAGVTAGKTRSNVGIWGDVDNDGNVDLFVTNEDTTNMLFLNNGNRRFKDITKFSGLTSARGGKGATFGDLDSDGDLDLVVPNYSLANRVYRNEGIQPKSGFPFFTDMTDEWLPPGPDSLAKSASACLGDYDNDGDLDLYIANMVFSNRLYENDGTGHFSDVTESAGLLDSSMSNSPCFFDADNDGDLDLFVSNRGRNLFYKNTGNKKFIHDENFIDLEPDAFSNGLACGDPDIDGDIDCYLANDDKHSVYYENKQDNKNFIELKLIGTKSNRDAIGAKAFLYEAGFLGQQSHLLGFREINGGSGFGSMNSTTIHFGADSSKKYDLKIWFPSGIVINRTNVRPGQILTIEEQNGIAKWISTSKRTLSRIIQSPVNQYAFVEFMILLAAFAATLKYFVRRQFFDSALQKYALLFPLFIYIFISFISFEGNYFQNHVMPISVSISIFAAIILLNKKRKQRINREQLAEELLLSCRIFDHGSWALTYLSQLQLFSVNLAPNETVSENAGSKLTETITGFYHQVYKEIERIAQLAQETEIKSHQGAEMHRQLLFLSENLNKIKVTLAMKKGVEAEVWNNVYRLVDQIRMNIHEINYGAVSFFSCDVFEVIYRVMAPFREQKKINIVLNQPMPIDEAIYVCIKSGELAPILENLITNAIRATQDIPEARIEIDFRHTDRYFLLEISDNGIGIPKKMWEIIFEENVTSKNESSGGLGLFYSRKTLEKYGGSIDVVKSSKNKGTTFSVKLKRI